MKLLLKIITCAILVVNIRADCNVCQEGNQVACHSRNRYSLCEDGIPSEDYLLCPDDYICTGEESVCYSPENATPSCLLNDEDYDDNDDVTTISPPIVERNQCGICDADKVFACLDETSYGFCFGMDTLMDGQSNIVMDCPENTVCNIDNKEFCTDSSLAEPSCIPSNANNPGDDNTTTSNPTETTGTEEDTTSNETTTTEVDTSTIATETNTTEVDTSTTATETTTTEVDTSTTATETATTEVDTSTTATETTTTEIETTATETTTTEVDTTTTEITTTEVDTTTTETTTTEVDTTATDTTPTTETDTTTSKTTTEQPTTLGTDSTITESTTTRTETDTTATVSTTVTDGTTTEFTITTETDTTTEYSTTSLPTETTSAETIITPTSTPSVPRSPTEICQDKGLSGFYQTDMDSSCTKFIICYGSPLLGIEKSCPAEQYFNPERQICTANRPEGCVYDTTTPTSSETTTTTSYDVPRDHNQICADEGSSGSYKTEEDLSCTKFVYCYSMSGSMHGMVKSCPSGQYFHPDKKICLAAKPEGCP